MAVYRIRDVLTGSRKSQNPSSLFKLSDSLQASDSLNTNATRRAAHSLTYEVELPVEEFMSNTSQQEKFRRYHSVSADVYKSKGNTFPESSTDPDYDEGSCPKPTKPFHEVPDNNTAGTVQLSNEEITEAKKQESELKLQVVDDISTFFQPLGASSTLCHSNPLYPDSATNAQCSTDGKGEIEEMSRPLQDALTTTNCTNVHCDCTLPHGLEGVAHACSRSLGSSMDQNEFCLSVPELTLASMRNSSRYSDGKVHFSSCENLPCTEDHPLCSN